MATVFILCCYNSDGSSKQSVTHQTHSNMVVNCMQLLVTHSSWGGCQNKSCMGSSSDSPSKSLAMRGQTYLGWGGRIGHAVHVVQGHGYVLYFCEKIFCGLFTRQWTTTVKLTNLFQIVIASLIPRFSPRTNEKLLFCIASDRKLGCSSPLFAMKVRSSTVSWISVSISTILWFSHCNDAMVVRDTMRHKDTGSSYYKPQPGLCQASLLSSLS